MMFFVSHVRRLISIVVAVSFSTAVYDVTDLLVIKSLHKLQRRTRYKRNPTSFNGWRARNNAIIVSVFVSFVLVLLPFTSLKCCYWSQLTIACKIIWDCFSATTDTFSNFLALSSSFTVFSFYGRERKVDHNKI